MSGPNIFWIFVIPVVVINSVSCHRGYTCECPDEWMDNVSLQNVNETDTDTNDAKMIYKFSELRKWPGGVVPYKLNETLTAHDKSQFKLAVQEFDYKTCVRFRPWSSEDLKYVIIERNEEIGICGKSQFCVSQDNSSLGYQYLRINGECGDKETFVHEMGHTICLGHEHQRKDRDVYISFENCTTEDAPTIRKKGIIGGIYDYASQMHYDCKQDSVNDGSLGCKFATPKEKEWTLCGPQLHDGLSVIDVDTINELYNCQGCLRHRWKPIKELTQRDYENMYHFGHMDDLRRPLYPCRVSYEGRVQVGMYTREEKKCKLANRCEKSNLEMNGEVEVLTIPNGLINERFQYKLIDLSSEDKSTVDLVKIGVPAGMGLYEAGGGRVVNGYNIIAYHNLTWEQYFDSEYDDESETSVSNNMISVISSVWELNMDFGFIGNVRGISPKYISNINILVCEEV